MSSKSLAVACTMAVLMSAVSPAHAAKKKSDEPPSREVVGRDEVEGEIIGHEIEGSPFKKLEIGMSLRQVRDVVGKTAQEDAECGSYFTGKSFIPFHFGGDKVRKECHYKGLGRLVFTTQSDFNDRAVLIKVEYDASEDGYRE